MKTIWKFPLALGKSILKMPAGSISLFAGDQRGALQLWAQVETEAPIVRRLFSVYGTGEPMEEIPGRVYVGSVLSLEGHLVWHVYEYPGADVVEGS